MGDPIASAVAAETAKGLVAISKHCIKYIWNYNTNIKSLREELGKIKDIRETIDREVMVAKNNAEDIRQDVLGWLNKYEDLMTEVDELIERAKKVEMRCLGCRFPKLKSRYSVSVDAANKTILMRSYFEEVKNIDKVGLPKLPGQLPFLSRGQFFELNSRTSIVEKALSALEDDAIFMIGICGMGGVGKTTLVKKIADKVKKDKTFDKVAMAVVSKEAKINEIQGALASRLGLDLSNKPDTQARAELLFQRLADTTENKILIILDDLWAELDLLQVGIPEPHRGLKIILTSRDAVVCRSMGVQERLKVDTLDREEAWDLFKMTIRISDPVVLNIAAEVVKECAGLPLAIVTIGKFLEGKSDYTFRAMLQQLREPFQSDISEVPDQVYKSIQLSYDNLGNRDSKSILLICALFEEDSSISIDQITLYAMGLVVKAVDELKNKFLLLEGEGCVEMLEKGEDSVKMHDIVRDVCLSISRKDGHNHMVCSESLEEWPRNTELTTSLWLQDADFDIFPTNMKWPRLQFLRLFKTSYVPFCPVEGMQKLKVLEVFSPGINLTSGYQCLTELRSLFLFNCSFLEGDLSIIRRLKRLRALSFCGCRLRMIPKEIAELTGLKLLDLRVNVFPSTTELGTPPIPLGVLSSLEELEELFLGYNFGRICESNELEEQYCESFKEVRKLVKLHTIQILTASDLCMKTLLENLNLHNLIRFHIMKCSEFTRRISFPSITRWNILKLRNFNAINVNNLHMLMWKANRLAFEGVEGFSCLIEGLGRLEVLSIEACPMFESLVGRHPHGNEIRSAELLALL